MQILLISDSYYPFINGVTTQVDLLKRYLELRGHRILLVAPCSSKCRQEKNVIYLPAIRFRFKFEFDVIVPRKVIKKVIESYNPDVIHLHGGTPIMYISILLAKQYRIPTILTFHTDALKALNYAVKGKLNNFIKGVMEKYFKKLFNEVDLITFPSYYSYRSYKNLIKNKNKVKVVYNGIEINKFSRIKRKPAKKFLYVHLGRLSIEKNIKLIIKCFNHFYKRNKKGFLFFIGTGYLYKIIKNKKLRRILFLGYKDDKFVLNLYKYIDFFVFASEFDTFGLAPLEALASGVPVLAYYKTFVAELLRDYGLVFKNKEEFESISKEIINVSLEKDLRKLANKFDINRIIEVWEKTYKNIS